MSEFGIKIERSDRADNFTSSEDLL